MAKYKVGDKVRIVSKRPDSPAFPDSMCKYLGQVVTIDKVLDLGKPSYKMREDTGKPEFFLPRLIPGDIADGWIWMEDWISGLVEEAPKEISSEVYSVHLRFCGSLTVAELMKDGKVVKVANARCNQKDTYDRGEGAKVAVNRLFEKKAPAEERVSPPKEWHVGDKAVVVRKVDAAPRNRFPVGTAVTILKVYTDWVS